MISVRPARGGMRRTASSTFPFSFLHGMTTDTARSSSATADGTVRATTTCVIQSLLRNGRRAQRRFKKTDSRGKYFGKRTIRCVSRASKPASFNKFRMSAVESQFCSLRNTFILVHSAKVTSGSQRLLYVVTNTLVLQLQSGFKFLNA